MATKRALCIGLNYPGTGSQLEGCVNDAYDWSAVLRRRGFTAETLLNDAGTRGAIVAALERLIAATAYQETLVVTYSGHGTWQPDRDGDEIDGRDEAWVPADYANGKLISDDDLHTLFSRKRYGARILLISDSCHSGTMNRVLPEEGQGKPRFLPPADIFGVTRALASVEQKPRAALGDNLQGALMSGCNDYEYSYDAVFNNRPNGAFTKQAIACLPTTGPISLVNWHAAIRKVLPSRRYAQTPQLNASTAQKSWTI